MRAAITVILVALALTAARATADLKALFAFNERFLSATMPRLDYRIETWVNEEGRYVLIRSPRDPPDGSPPFQIEIQMERIPPGAEAADYEARAIARSVDKLGLDTADLPPGTHPGAGLAEPQELQVAWNDTGLRAHKGVLLCAVDDGVGMILLLDVLQEDYDAAESVCLGILESIRFE